MIKAIKEDPILVFLFACAVVVGFVIVFAIFKGVEFAKSEDTFLAQCLESGYVGLDWVANEPVCYGYVEGNRLIIKPVAEIESDS